MKTIFIGAGHSEKDPGAVSADGKLREADLAMRLRDLIAQVFIARGVIFKTDGPPRVNLHLRDSIRIARECDGPRVEIHFNAGPATANGVEALSRAQEKPLAQALAQSVAGATGSRLRGDAGWKDQGAGQHHRLGFCMDAHGVVLEVEFISNPSLMKRYLGAELQVAEAVARVLAEFANKTAPLA